MSATANTPSQPAAPESADLDITEAEVLAALGQPAPAESPDPAAASEAEPAPEATTPDPEPAPEGEPAAEAPEAEATPETTAAQQLADLQAKIAALEAKIAAAPSVPAAPPVIAPAAPAAERPPITAATPEVFATVTDSGELAAREIGLSRLYAWSLRNEDGGKLGDTDLSRQDILELRANVHEALYQHIPARRAFLADTARAEAAAIDAHPWLKDTASTDTQAVERFLSAHPSLRQIPNGRMIAADAILGAKARTSTTAAKPATVAARPAQPPRPPASPARAGVLPPRISPRASESKAAMARLSRTGSVDDLASVIAADLP